MRVSVIIPTRDRPDDLARCLPTILANEYLDFEVLVVDQSTNDASQRVVAALADPRLRYHRQSATGKSRALNYALAEAGGDILAFTDDDCTVSPDWLGRAVAALAEEPEVGLVFGTLAAVAHDPREAFVPAFLPLGYRRLQGGFARVRCDGVVGANMVVRRAVFERLGGFDECLGPGSRFRSAMDLDFAYRALRAGFSLVQDPANVVVHWGRRDFADGSGRRLIRNYYYGHGARLAKHLRCADPLAAYALLRGVLREVTYLVGNLVRHRRLTGAGHLPYLMLGVIRGFQQPVDRQRWLYLPTRREELRG